MNPFRVKSLELIRHKLRCLVDELVEIADFHQAQSHNFAIAIADLEDKRSAANWEFCQATLLADNLSNVI